MKPTKLGMMANDSPRAVDLALESAAYLKDQIGSLLAEDHLLRAMAAKNQKVCSSLRTLNPATDQVDLVLVFGGDGTILRTVQSFGSLSVPVCGINMGRTGFLSQVEPKDLIPALKRLASGKFDVVSRMKVDVRLGAERLGSALNELLVQGTRTGKILRANVHIDSLGDLMLEGDGVIVSTPTGSTGHSLSAGGPVVDCGLNAMIVAPLGAIRPIRPMVISSDREIVVLPGDDCCLAMDGRVVGNAHQGNEVRVCRSESKAVFAVLDSDLFWTKLRQRIGG